MSRFLLSREADRDLDEIERYLDILPSTPATAIGLAIHKTLNSIAAHPLLGATQSEVTRLAGVEVRSRLVRSYRIFDAVGAPIPEVLAILHTSRDIRSILVDRLQ